jgi:hypothetical protein
LDAGAPRRNFEDLKLEDLIDVPQAAKLEVVHSKPRLERLERLEGV